MPNLAFEATQTILDFLNTPILLAILAYLIYMARKLGEFNVRLKHLEDIHKTNNPQEGGQNAAAADAARQLEPDPRGLVDMGIHQANQP